MQYLAKKLKPFSPNSKTKVIVGASEFAISGILEQEGSPIICVSRKLSASEQGIFTNSEGGSIHIMVLQTIAQVYIWNQIHNCN